LLTGAHLDGASFASKDGRAARLTFTALVNAKSNNQTTWPDSFVKQVPARVAGRKSGPHAGHDVPVPDAASSVTVTKVQDGDSVIADGKEMRLLGLNAPEQRTPLGKVATKLLQQLLPIHGRIGATVRVISPKPPNRFDKFGRRLVYVWLPNGA